MGLDMPPRPTFSELDAYPEPNMLGSN